MSRERPDKTSFMELPVEEVRRLVLQKKNPLTGIFVADGNRRLVMTQTGLIPTADGFYEAYLKIITEFFMENLRVFFSHGLHTLLFPLFGSSLLARDETYRQTVMPELVRILFNSEEWQSFYREQGIRIHAYGDLNLLDRHFNDLNLMEKIKQGEQLTAAHPHHRLFYGFFSNSAFDRTFIEESRRFLHDHNRVPNPGESAKIYYGEPVDEADFFITSTRPGYLGALPPFAYGKNTRVYTLAAPGVFALNENTYREILFDIFHSEPHAAGTNPAGIDADSLRELGNFYRRNRNRVIGTGKMIGQWWVPDETN